MTVYNSYIITMCVSHLVFCSKLTRVDWKLRERKAELGSDCLCRRSSCMATSIRWLSNRALLLLNTYVDCSVFLEVNGREKGEGGNKREMGEGKRGREGIRG